MTAEEAVRLMDERRAQVAELVKTAQPLFPVPEAAVPVFPLISVNAEAVIASTYTLSNLDAFERLLGSISRSRI